MFQVPLLDHVEHVDPDEGETEEEAGEEESEDVENHEGSEAGDGNLLHSVETKDSDAWRGTEEQISGLARLSTFESKTYR